MNKNRTQIFNHAKPGPHRSLGLLRKATLTTLLVGLTLSATLGAATAPLQIDGEPEVLAPERDQLRAARMVRDFVSQFHYRDIEIDDTLSSEMLDRFIESLDPNRSYFLASDIERFEAYRTLLDDELRASEVKRGFDFFNVYRARVNERVGHALDLLDREWDFTVDETVRLDRSESPWAADPAELNEVWRKRVKNDVLQLKLANKEPDEIQETLERRYTELARRVNELDSEDAFQFYMNAFAGAIEPHTAYLAPRTSENFRISMRLSLEGIGAVLQREAEYTTVRRIVAGGPASQSGLLDEGDRIVGVGQGEDEEIVDVIGWRLDDVVDLIRGPKDSTVVLEIIPAEASLDSEPEAIALVRNKVKLEEQAAQSEVVDFDQDGTTRKVGVITLPTFYLDFAARARREPDYRSTTRDVRRLLSELTDQGVEGVIVDLRNNGGGSLLEATELTGLFIDEGPVVQVRDSRGSVEVERDPNPGVVYSGPLAVLVNRHSASASEIFAAAIQDYGRGIIIGEQTYGKGTVQNLISLDQWAKSDEPRLGQLKITMAQFYRVNGGSTQHRGVIPDIVFPTTLEEEEYGESALENALPWNEISPAEYQAMGNLADAIAFADTRSDSRIERDVEFGYLLEDLNAYRETRDRGELSLLEEQRRAERDEQERKREAREAERAERNGITIGTLANNDEESSTGDDGDTDDASLNGDTASEEEQDEDDVILDEAIRVLADLITVGDPDQRTAQRNDEPKPLIEEPRS